MGRFIGFLYGTIVYVFFFGVFLYLIAFVGNITEFMGIKLPVTRTIDGPGTYSGAEAYLINFGLLALFGLQHSVMARQGFKAKLKGMVGDKMERPTYVLATNLLLVLLYCYWRPVADVVWAFDGIGATLMWVGFTSGWGLILLSTLLIDHFELFGLKQALYHLKGKDLPKYKFVTPLFYKLVRHPLYFGWLLAFWCIPVMTAGHITLSAVWTIYIFIAISYEEKDLTATFGKKYTDYQKSTPMIIPLTKFKK